MVELVLFTSERGGGGEQPPEQGTKLVPVVRKKTLIDLLELVCKSGYLLFVPKKK